VECRVCTIECASNGMEVYFRKGLSHSCCGWNLVCVIKDGGRWLESQMDFDSTRVSNRYIY